MAEDIRRGREARADGEHGGALIDRGIAARGAQPAHAAEQQTEQQAKAAVSSIALVAKRPDQFGKAMIFPAMVETYAVLALLVSLLAVANIGGIAI